MYSFKEPYVLCWEIYGSSEYIVLVCMSYFRLIFRMDEMTKSGKNYLLHFLYFRILDQIWH